jgi:acyl carrier protein
MVPSAFVCLPAFPLTDNGKIDRKALLALPPPSFATGAVTPQSHSEPASDIERIVAHAWQDALGVATVGLNDNFFDLGAHSLTVAEVHARLQDVLGREIALIDLFHFSTVKELAAHLAGTQPQSQVSDRAQRRRLALKR